MPALRLIVGLGNPGPQYEGTRHNVGVRFVEMLARRYGVSLASESRFKGRVGRTTLHGHDVRLLIPNTFMNLSGESVGALTTFLKIAPAEILVAHDEMAFPVGVVRLKEGGGHNGHNGLKDIIQALGNSADFLRLRIGVGHPGDQHRVSGYLTSARMPAEDRDAIDRAIDLPDAVIEYLVHGELLKAMNILHTAPSPKAED